MRTKIQRVVIIFAFIGIVAVCQGKIIYVDADATGANNGKSWADAYNYLQDALADANTYPNVDEIRVAQGIYKPDETTLDPNGTGDRNAAFQLINGVALKGGYAGLGQPDPNARDNKLYETILNGDLSSNDIELSNPSDMWYEPSRYDNSYHVVTGSMTNTTAILDGFIITSGYNTGLGAGMYIANGNPTVSNCTFTWNSAEWGGGMGNSNGSPTVLKCRFKMNAAMGGGGIDNVENSHPILISCTFSSNSGLWKGGGMVNGEAGIGGSSSPTLINCTFNENSTDGYGGAIYNTFDSSPTLTNCTFIGNRAERGGAVYSYRGSISIMTNCIFWGDTATLGNEIYLAFYSATWPSVITVNYSDVQGGSTGVYVEPGSTLNWGVGNIDVDPCFIDPCNGDYHIKSEGWRWDNIRERWDYDEVTSRCIDAGNPGSALKQEPLTIPDDPNNIWGENLRINMGAYGGTAEASIPPYDWALLADIDNDGTVDFKDYAYQASDFHADFNEMPGDLNRNGAVTEEDLSLLTTDWLKKTSWAKP